MFSATRRRLALWYTAATATLLLFFAAGFYQYVRLTLIDRVDDTLSHVVEVVERSLVVETSPAQAPRLNLAQSFQAKPEPVPPELAQPDLAKPDPLIPSQASPRDLTINLNDHIDDHIDLEWFDPEGHLLWSTLDTPFSIPLSPQAQTQTVMVAPDLWLRQMTDPVVVMGQPLGFLRASHPWFEVTKPTRQLVQDLSLGLGVTISFVAVIGWVLSGLAMRPVRESYQQLKQFTADASHELRNPLASLQTHVQVTLADPLLDPSARQPWQVVERLTQRFGRLVDDLLFLTRQDGGMIPTRDRLCALDALLLQVVEDQQALAVAQDLHLTLVLPDLPPDVSPASAVSPTPKHTESEDPDRKAPNPLEDIENDTNPFGLWGDEDHLLRLFTNLVENAIHYTPPGGQITLTLQPHQRGALSMWRVKVQDTGIGIPAADLPHVFDRFYRVDQARTAAPHRLGGSGLGLAIAKAIVTEHQGQIRVSSEADQGTTITVTLPVLPPPEANRRAG